MARIVAPPKASGQVAFPEYYEPPLAVQRRRKQYSGRQRWPRRYGEQPSR